MKIAFRPAAVADLRSALEYYDDAKPGLEDDLIDDVDRLRQRLQTFPRSAPAVAGYDSVRRAMLRRFPYAVFYEFGESVEVLRVVHTARHPEAWRR
ncbi:type II toxin-antitoxin system RelE/ParE family toxin [Jiangella rhizosphaerae]|uniref:type II toxin-antitoxin system RelE/ParE family toxin n=1 Tax=Jiangella rhizosphaerae TaxID=2293569 RepID=UPI001314EA0D|nr:type II toxin-antitoxin system RelE/ParE family toxin [Jiangella rhizosphaerae]